MRAIFRVRVLHATVTFRGEHTVKHPYLAPPRRGSSNYYFRRKIPLELQSLLQLGPTNVRLELGRGSYRTIVRHLHLLALREAGKQAGGRLPM